MYLMRRCATSRLNRLLRPPEVIRSQERTSVKALKLKRKTVKLRFAMYMCTPVRPRRLHVAASRLVYPLFLRVGHELDSTG